MRLYWIIILLVKKRSKQKKPCLMAGFLLYSIKGFLPYGSIHYLEGDRMWKKFLLVFAVILTLVLFWTSKER